MSDMCAVKPLALTRLTFEECDLYYTWDNGTFELPFEALPLMEPIRCVNCDPVKDPP